MSESSLRLVLCNCPKDKVDSLSRELVERRLAACVNVIPVVASVYTWEGRVHVDEESTMLVKTTSARFGELVSCLETLHPYDVPEIIEVPLGFVHLPYLDWALEVTGE